MHDYGYVNMLNKQLWTGSRGWSFSLQVGWGANSAPLKDSLLWNITHGLKWVHVNMVMNLLSFIKDGEC